jgi:hypothetical protein
MGVILFSFESSGSFNKTENFLQRMLKGEMFNSLERFAQEGVAALASATPVDSGLTAGSWNYEITKSRGFYQIVWTNSNVVDGRPIAIMLQYGHGTGTGGYVEGYDYINPAMRPVFDRIAENVWKAVTSA